MTQFTLYAKSYLACGLCALPADGSTKRPTKPWKGYQDKLPTVEEWVRWGETTSGICIITGKTSRNLVVIDFDDKGSRFEAWKQKLPKELFDRLMTVQTPSGGYHVYARRENEPMGNTKLARAKGGETLIETRGEGGLVIAPPPPGYEKIAGSIEHIPVLSSDEMDMLLNAARSFDEMPKRNTRSTATSAVSPKKPVGKKKAVQRAIAYINKMPEAIEGCNGSADAMRAANKLYEFGLDIDTAKQVFIEHYNPRCKPEWSEKEIDHKLDTAYNKPLKEAGCMLTSDIVLDPKEPLSSADKFLETDYMFNGIQTLIHYAQDYWQWEGNAYRKIETGEVRSRLLHFLEQAKIKCKGDGDDTPTYAPFPVAPAKLSAVASMLEGRIFRSASDSIPRWIGGASCEMPSSVIDPLLLMFGKNVILNLADMGILPHTPHWFNTAALDYDYDPNAECPQWRAFLDSILGDDEESKQTLMEWIGLCLTSITKFQKALFIIGKKRSGKGTINRILQKIVGKHNAVSPKTSHFGKDFGLQSFIGKNLAVVSDARFPKDGMTQVIEGILNITGEDMITIDRKFRDALTVRLPTKLMFLSNDVPTVTDPSGAFASRFIFLKLPKSFYGKEDLELTDKLSCELPGILRLAIQHLQILLDRGRFIQPESGKKLAERMAALSSPVGDFIQQLQPRMTKEEIWQRWVEFCFSEAMGHGKKRDLWNNLESAGYDCDFDTANILAIIKQLDGEAKTQDFRDHNERFRKMGEPLKIKVQAMVKSGLLTVRVGERNVEYYSIANAVLDSSCDDSD